MASKGKVLICDDEVSIAGLLQVQLAYAGYESIPATSPHEAVAAMRDYGPFDCAVLDYMLPEMTGLDLLASLRRYQSDLPCVFLTARAEDSLQKDISRLKCRFVAKPYMAESVIVEVERAIADKEAS